MEPTTAPSTPPPVATAVPPTASITAEDKTVAILSYLTLLGFIAALIIHSNKKTSLGSFHLRQTLGFFLTVIAFSIGQFVLLIIPIIGWLALPVIWIALFVLAVMGLVSAIKGEMKPMPLVGPLYQKWFGNTFN
jgi:uncharacterized membrane protein